MYRGFVNELYLTFLKIAPLYTKKIMVKLKRHGKEYDSSLILKVYSLQHKKESNKLISNLIYSLLHILCGSHT